LTVQTEYNLVNTFSVQTEYNLVNTCSEQREYNLIYTFSEETKGKHEVIIKSQTKQTGIDL